MSPVVLPNCFFLWFWDSLLLQCSMLFLVSTREYLRGERRPGIFSPRMLTVAAKLNESLQVPDSPQPQPRSGGIG